MTVAVHASVDRRTRVRAAGRCVDLALPLQGREDPDVPPKGDGTVNTRVLLVGTLAVATGAIGVLFGHRNAVAWQRAGGPERVPSALRSAPSEPAAWVFVRPGCRHCADHLWALERAVQARPESLRARILARICIVGEPAERPAGSLTLPDSLRRIFDVRITPTTWWIAGNGAIRSAWRGARGEVAWSRGLDFLAERPGVVP